MPSSVRTRTLSASLFMKYLSCDMKNTVPSYTLSAFSRTSFDSMSRWLVGSSRNRKFAFESISLRRDILDCSPPLSEDILL